MSISLIPLIPKELKREIVNYTVPCEDNISGTPIRVQIKALGREYVNLSLVDTDFRDACKPNLDRIKSLIIKIFVELYHVDDEPNSQLVDALYTGTRWPGTPTPSYNWYTAVIESDIKDIVILMPECLNKNIGYLKCSLFKMPPLLIAIMNSDIPVNVIEFLLQRGANPNTTYTHNCHRDATIISHLGGLGLYPEREAAVRALLLQYGAQ